MLQDGKRIIFARDDQTESRRLFIVRDGMKESAFHLFNFVFSNNCKPSRRRWRRAWAWMDFSVCSTFDGFAWFALLTAFVSPTSRHCLKFDVQSLVTYIFDRNGVDMSHRLVADIQKITAWPRKQTVDWSEKNDGWKAEFTLLSYVHQPVSDWKSDLHYPNIVELPKLKSGLDMIQQCRHLIDDEYSITITSWPAYLAVNTCNQWSIVSVKVSPLIDLSQQKKITHKIFWRSWL